MPRPLFTKLVAQAAIGFFCVLIGCIYSIQFHDRIFLILSLLIGLCSIVRFISFYQMIRFHRYLTIEGQCKKREPSMFKKTMYIFLVTEDGREYRFTLDRSVRILLGHYYRLYFRINKSDSKNESADILNTLQDFLGVEEIAFAKPKEISESP